MTEKIEIDRETLELLMSFTDIHAAEYGDLEIYHAIIDAALALGYDDPTPSQSLDGLDVEGLRSWPKYSDKDVDEYIERYNKYR